MFLQKLQLEQKSYSTTTTKENLVENLQLQFNLIPIITPYSSKAMKDDAIIQSESKNEVTLSISQYLQHSASFDCSHIVIENYELYSEFGLDLAELDKPIIVLEEFGKCASNLERLPLCSFSIKAEKNEQYVALFILTKMFKSAVIVDKKEKCDIFCRVFEIECDIFDFNEDFDANAYEAVIYMDKFVKIESERVFLIGKRTFKLEKLSLDLSLAGKYKYRINDVLQAISPAVLNKKRQFDYTRFSRVNE